MNKVPFVVTGFRRREEADAYAKVQRERGVQANVLDAPLRVVEVRGSGENESEDDGKENPPQPNLAHAVAVEVVHEIAMEFYKGQLEFMSVFLKKYPMLSVGQVLVLYEVGLTEIQTLLGKRQ